MWSITQLRSMPGSALPRTVAAEPGCAPDFSSAFFDAGPDLHAVAASNASPAAARTPRLRSAALQFALNAISILLIEIRSWVTEAAATCCLWIMHFITRIYQIVSLLPHSNNARY